jgi:Peptidase family M28/PDZ domain/PA domain
MRSCFITRMLTRGRRYAGGVMLLVWAIAPALLAAPAAALDDGDKPNPARAEVAALSPAAERMKADVTFLAADAQDGRAPGTKGIEVSAEYVAGVFKAAGLKPAPGSAGYFQPFSISGTPTLGDTQELVLTSADGKQVQGAFSTDFNPMAVGVGAKIDHVPIAFAGYGITAKDEGLKIDYDDYAGIDVKGKAVLIIRHEPQQADDASPFDGKKTTVYATFQHKATNAFQHGAVAVLLANDQAGLENNKDELLPFTRGGTEVYSNLPFVMVSRDFADKLLNAAGAPTLARVEKEIDNDLKPRSRDLDGWALSEKIEINRQGIETKNVVGVLEGAGPNADETVVLGGHYDHLGHGGMLSGSLAIFSRDIHNGADDNASGTSMVLELARRLGARQDPPPRRVVFIAFSGEEKGLLGSQYYVAHPLFPLSSTVMMINCDMVGRLNASNELTMIGTGTAPGIDLLVDVLGKSAGLTIKKVAGMTDGFGGSDHQSFYANHIPVLFAFTGIHGDYHRPSDDSQLINFSGMGRIADYLELIALDVIRRPDRPTYVAIRDTRAPRAVGGGPSVASLGVMPDYGHEANDGLSLAGVREGGPAAQAGLKQGDLVIKVGDRKVGTIYDYMEIMNKHKPGEKIDVVVKRDGKDVKLPVTLGRRTPE